jgi:5-(carboxyamino)imidazole ribonucleotide synthase
MDWSHISFPPYEFRGSVRARTLGAVPELINPRPHGATVGPRVGILGAGQLARMDVQAAIALDLEVRVLAGSDRDAAVLAGAEAVVGDHTELAVLEAFAAGVDVVTFEFEGIDPEHLRALEQAGHRLVPAPAAKLLAQDKLVQRRVLSQAGFPVPPFAHARTEAEAEAFGAEHGWPIIAKAPRGGYDGRGVAVVGDAAQAGAFIAELPAGALLEPTLTIERELAVQVARTADGATVAYPVVETVQREAMLRELIAPAEISPQRAAEAVQLATAIVDRIGATGLIAVELFLTVDGLLVNELAMRPHNSGHHTIEATQTSQFEQHLRAALGWPLGSTELVAAAAVTVNVVGPADGSDPRTRREQALAIPGAHVHLYGKTARPGRKLGHVTALGPDVAVARDTAWRAVNILEGEI